MALLRNRGKYSRGHTGENPASYAARQYRAACSVSLFLSPLHAAVIYANGLFIVYLRNFVMLINPPPARPLMGGSGSKEYISPPPAAKKHSRENLSRVNRLAAALCALDRFIPPVLTNKRRRGIY